jgi:hypothetical protein
MFSFLQINKKILVSLHKWQNPNHAKFEGLLSICNAELYKRLSIFIRKAAALL